MVQLSHPESDCGEKICLGKLMWRTLCYALETTQALSLEFGLSCVVDLPVPILVPGLAYLNCTNTQVVGGFFLFFKLLINLFAADHTGNLCQSYVFPSGQGTTDHASFPLATRGRKSECTAVPSMPYHGHPCLICSWTRSSAFTHTPSLLHLYAQPNISLLYFLENERKLWRGM